MDVLNKQEVFDTLLKLEQSLANFESKEIAESALTDDFVEFSSSGRVYNKNDVIKMYEVINNIQHTITDYTVEFLSDTVAMASFKSNLDANMALRTSIWKLADREWRMRFHQGTVYKD